MIQANEIRIGNWASTLGVAIVITADHIKAISEGDTMYKPILLTPEILGMAGFVKDDSDLERWHYEKSQEISYPTDMCLEQDEKGGFHLIDAGGREIGDTITHLHQLQNLTFTFTGEELKIEL